MTLIVVSLFLPYQPQFEVNATKNEAAELAGTKLVKVDSGGDSKRKKRNSSVHSISPFLSPNISDESARLGGYEEVSATPTEHLDPSTLTSEQFLENLTSGTAPSSAGTANPALNKSASVEDFFAKQTASQSPYTPQESSIDAALDDSTQFPENELANKLSALASRPVVHSAVGGGHNAGIFGQSGTVVTPISRHVPDTDTAVMDMAMVKEKHQEFYSALPSMKRTSFSNSNIKVDLSDLKHHFPRGLPNTIDEVDSSDSDTDSDLETDSKLEYNVPKFGGYSSKSKAKGQFLRHSHELFAQLPWKIVPSEKGNGAMKNAINIGSAEKTIHDPVLWVGTVGIPTDEIPKDICRRITDSLEKDYSSAAVISDDITFKGAYKNFCKQILWPTLHYIIPDNPNSKAFEDHSWNYYQKLNQQFADKIVSVYKEGDTIWIQDYHLMLVPDMVRKRLPEAKIGFYLHVSFPSSEVFRVFAHREEILEGILGANSVGFQNKEYARHFLQTANRLIMADVSEGELKYDGKIISVTYTPVGIDFFTLRKELDNDNVRQWRNMIRKRWSGKKLIVCRDQFDTIRGIDKKMLAYECFLNENPEYIDKIVLIQICLSKYESPELERQVMVIVDRINSLSSNISTSQSVVILHQEIDFPQYLALSSEADLFFITSLREGMNLTCHEFVVCSEDKNAPLLLSEFTGSASVLKEGALLINPWDTNHIAKTIKHALDMSSEEKRRDWKKLMKAVINNDSDNWIASSLERINDAWDFNKERSTVFNLSHQIFAEDYKKTRDHLFIFKISDPPNARTISMLNELTSRNTVYVLNSFSKTTIDSLYSRVLNIGLIAENGAYVKLNGHWHNVVQHIDWIPQAVKILNDKVERLPGSYYKVADSMIRFHTENAEDKERVSAVVGEAITHINTSFDSKGIHAYVYKNIVFVQEIGLSLAAMRYIFKYYNSSSNSNQGQFKTSDGSVSNNGNKQGHVEFACITGSSSPVIEPLFKLINETVNNGTLRVGYSIVYGDPTSTYAKEHVNGLNELFSLVNTISQ